MRILNVILLLAFFLPAALADDVTAARIVSLGPALTEQLYLLEAQEALVGVTTYCQNPPQAQEKEKVGTVIEANLEKIIQLTPDLVLATPLTNPEAVRKLESLGIRVKLFPRANDFSQICAQFGELARLVGKEDRARAVIEQAQLEVEALRQTVQDQPKVKVFVQVGANPLFAATRDSFINDFIEFASGINIVSATRTGSYSREQVLKDNPDVIVIISMGIVGAQEKEIWEQYPSLQAVQNGRIYVVDDYLFCSPTPLSFAQGLKKMIAILHPDNG